METESNRERFRGSGSGRVFAGLILVFIGAVLLGRQFGLDIPGWVTTWQMFLVSLGFFFGARQSFRFGGWAIMVLVGAVFLFKDFYPGVLVWEYVWPAAIIVAGLFMILRPRRVRRRWDGWKVEPDTSDNIIEINSVFGASKKKVLSKEFKGGEINSVFSGNDLDLTQADFNGAAKLELNIVFGGVKLIVPSHWRIKSEVDCVFGAVEDKRRETNAAAENKTLVLKGSVVFGSIEIKSY
jgi:predicted membrane protein